MNRRTFTSQKHQVEGSFGESTTQQGTPPPPCRFHTSFVVFLKTSDIDCLSGSVAGRPRPPSDEYSLRCCTWSVLQSSVGPERVALAAFSAFRTSCMCLRHRSGGFEPPLWDAFPWEPSNGLRGSRNIWIQSLSGPFYNVWHPVKQSQAHTVTNTSA